MNYYLLYARPLPFFKRADSGTSSVFALENAFVKSVSVRNFRKSRFIAWCVGRCKKSRKDKNYERKINGQPGKAVAEALLRGEQKCRNSEDEGLFLLQGNQQA